MDKELDKKYINKCLYVFPGLGKTYAMRYNEKVADTDQWLKKVFSATDMNLREMMNFVQDYNPHVYDQKILYLKQKINEAKTKGYVILTPNEKFIDQINLGFLPKFDDLETIHFRLKNRSLNNYNIPMDKLVTKYRRIETKLKNRNIPITYLDLNSYISTILFNDENNSETI